MTKDYKQKMFFSVLTKNLNWKVLHKNLVTFKRWDGIRVFQVAVRDRGKFSSVKGELEILQGVGWIFLPCEGDLRRSDFDNSNLFQR